MSTSTNLENFGMQLAEIEMLGSMFPKHGEFSVSDPLALQMMRRIVTDEKLPEADAYSSCGQISFTLKIQVTGGCGTNEDETEEDSHVVEVSTNLPHTYPWTKPIISLSGMNITKLDHQRLHDDLDNFMQELPEGELVFSYVVQWLQEHGYSYFKKLPEQKPVPKLSKQKQKSLKFTRLWIYSHHIYSKIKRKAILEYSAELNLTGFCMPGKPGMIVIEGFQDDVEEFWQRIRSMQWKRIMMKEREDHVIVNNVDSFRKFSGFEENSFNARLTKGRGAHADRGVLFSFLEERGCGHVFPYYFGVEGKSADAAEHKDSGSDSDD